MQPFSKNSARSRQKRYYRQFFSLSFTRRPEEDNDIISGVAIDYIGMDDHVTFGDSMINNMIIKINSLPAAPVLRTFVQYLVTFCSRPDDASDFISGSIWGPIIPNKPVKCRDPCLNHSREIAPDGVGGGIFDSFFAIISVPSRSRKR